MMRIMRKLTAALLSCLLLISLTTVLASAAAETAAKGGTMLGGDWKSLDGTWQYENGIFTVVGGEFSTDKRAGLQFTRESAVRDFTMEYEVYIADTCVDYDEVDVSFRTPQDSYLRKGLIVAADKYGYFYNDMVNWNNKTFVATPAFNNWAYNTWHKVKFIAKGARVNLSVDGGDAVNAVINKVTPDIDAQYDHGYINLTISSDGMNAIAKGYAKVKNVKMTIGDKVYAYLDTGITRPTAATSSATGTGGQTTSAPTSTPNHTGATSSSPKSASSTAGSASSAASQGAVSSEAGGTDSSIWDEESEPGAAQSTSSAVPTETELCGSGGLIAVIVILCVLAAAGVTVFVLFKKGILPPKKVQQ